jgi:Domain of unknown function(DUF2779)
MNKVILATQTAKKIVLSKAGFMTGRQCSKWGWVRHNAPERIPMPDVSELAAMEQGQIVGRLARNLFPAGVEIVGDSNDPDSCFEETKNCLDRRMPIFEAAFCSEELFVRADILNPIGFDEWDLYEVKATADVKEEHIWDVAFQVQVIAAAGLKLRRYHVVHINTEYVKTETIDIPSLFCAKDITVSVQHLKMGVAEMAKQIIQLTRKETCPPVPVGPHCNSPVSCPLKKECWSSFEKDTVTSLYRGGKKSWILFREGLVNLRELPAHVKLTDRQKIQVETCRSGKAHIRRSAIQEFIANLELPFHFVDFETVNPAIPIWSNSAPFEHVPFQCSLHILENWDSEPLHFSYLSEGRDDPRPEMMSFLVNSVRSEGAVLAYNATFEKSILNRCSLLFPEFRVWRKSIYDRFVDLLQPFRNFDYYSPAQQGSASMKDVLPALCGVDYSDLSIQDGIAASRAFLRMTSDEVSRDERKKIRSELEAYCGRDTYGMILILTALKRFIEP